MRKAIGSSLIVAALLAGCASTTKSPTQQEQARREWNDAQSTVLIGLASDQYKNGDFEKSRATINQALAMTPTSPAAHILSAKLYIEAGQLEPAEGELAETRKLDPRNAEADYLCGVIYQRWQQPEKALEYYQSACTKNPDELAYVLAKAEMLVSMDCRDQALTLLQSRMGFFEHSGEIRDEVGLLLMQEGRYPEAIELFRRAGILESDDLTIKEHLALALFFNDQYSESAGILSDLIADARFSHRSDLMITLGECQLQTAHAAEAVVTFQEASELSPDSTGIWFGLGRAELQTGSMRQAELAMRHGLALDEKSSEGHLLLGYVQLHENRVSDAYASFTRANQLDPSDTVSLCMVGLTLDRMGRKEQASDCFQQALRMKPGDQMAGQLLTNLDEGR